MVKKIITWVLLLPASILAALAAYWANVYTLGQFFINTDSSVGPPFIIDAVATFVGCGAFVGAGTYIAPAYKLLISIILTVLVSILCGTNLVFALLDYSGWQCTKHVILSICGIVSSIGVCFYFAKNLNEENNE